MKANSKLLSLEMRKQESILLIYLVIYRDYVNDITNAFGFSIEVTRLILLYQIEKYFENDENEHKTLSRRINATKETQLQYNNTSKSVSNDENINEKKNIK